MRSSLDDRPDMLPPQRRSEPTWNESVHQLHPLDVARGPHDFEKGTIERQRTRVLGKIGRACLAHDLRLLSI
jgi:hypothetical protein